MKKMILSLVMSVVSLVSFSQVYEVEFNKYVGFNSGSLGKYEEVIDSTNYRVKEFHNGGGVNKYSINLTTNTVSHYFNGTLFKSAKILTSKIDNGLLHITINDKESVSGNAIISNIVIPLDKSNNNNPKFIIYFLSTSKNTFNGFVAMK